MRTIIILFIILFLNCSDNHIVSEKENNKLNNTILIDTTSIDTLDDTANCMIIDSCYFDLTPPGHP